MLSVFGGVSLFAVAGASDAGIISLSGILAGAGLGIILLILGFFGTEFVRTRGITVSNDKKSKRAATAVPGNVRVQRAVYKISRFT